MSLRFICSSSVAVFLDCCCCCYYSGVSLLVFDIRQFFSLCFLCTLYLYRCVEYGGGYFVLVFLRFQLNIFLLLVESNRDKIYVPKFIRSRNISQRQWHNVPHLYNADSFFFVCVARFVFSFVCSIHC